MNAGPMETVFAASRDGLRWERYDREPFIPLGMKGEFDWASARTIWGLVPDTTGRYMYMYYRASDWLHGWDRDERNRKLLTGAGLGATQDVTVISPLKTEEDLKNLALTAIASARLCICPSDSRAISPATR